MKASGAMLIAPALGGCARLRPLACPAGPFTSRLVHWRTALPAELGEIGP